MNIALVGYRCSGKTSVGKIIAGEIHWSFLDTDVMIEERAGCPIEEIVSKEGWEHFREMEREIIRDLSDRENLVIATGGGVVMDEENVRNLKKNGLVVWLKAEIEVLKERMEKNHETGRKRPSLTGVNPAEEIREVLDIRDPHYRKAGDLTVDTTRRSIREVAEMIITRAARGRT